MVGMGDFEFALQMRELIKQIIADELAASRPIMRYGKVDSIDRVAYKCGVIFVGDVLPVTVSMGALKPSAIGQIVRVEGIGSDRYITDIVSDNGAWFNTTPTLTAVTTNPVLGTGGTATSRWRQENRIIYYNGEIKFGTAGFSVGSGQYSISLPVAADTTIPSRYIGTLAVNLGGNWQKSSVFINTSTKMYMWSPSSATSVNDSAMGSGGSGGAAFGASSIFRWAVVYEAAQ